ncbi:hypothetical protein, partial [Mesoflavibacter zeaxanthinifaciens]
SFSFNGKSCRFSATEIYTLTLCIMQKIVLNSTFELKKPTAQTAHLFFSNRKKPPLKKIKELFFANARKK